MLAPRQAKETLNDDEGAARIIATFRRRQAWAALLYVSGVVIVIGCALALFGFFAPYFSVSRDGLGVWLALLAAGLGLWGVAWSSYRCPACGAYLSFLHDYVEDFFARGRFDPEGSLPQTTVLDSLRSRCCWRCQTSFTGQPRLPRRPTPTTTNEPARRRRRRRARWRKQASRRAT